MAHTVLIALARGVCRDGLRQFLASVPGVSVAGSVRDGRSAVETAREVRPDIVVLEAHLPELNGVEATRQLVAEDPRIAVIFMAASADPPVVARILRTGARGFLLADGGLAELVEAIRTVMDGHVYLTPSVEDRVISSLDSYSGSAAGVLTAREREVLQLIAEGKPTRQIASILGVSTKTIETHRMRVMGKLKIRSVAGLTKYAIRNGLTSVT